MKRCSSCKKQKDKKEFGKDVSTLDKLDRRCKLCERLRGRSSIKKYKNYMKIYRQTDKYKKSHSSSSRRYIQKNPEKQEARRKAQTVKLKDNCEECGKSKKKLHRHHEDYSKPLEIIVLCPSCHKKKHYKPTS